MIQQLFELIFLSPFIWLASLALVFLLRVKIKERWLSESVKFFSLYMGLLTLVLFFLTLFKVPKSEFEYQNWIEVGDYQFRFRFLVDILSSTYALLTAGLIGVIFRFSRNYLHRENGYFRFIFLLSILMFGLIIVSFSRSLDFLFAGWELVGTTSVLLISYFYNRPLPVYHATKAIITYRICDIGILAAAAWAHLHLRTTDFTLMPEALQHANGGINLMLIGFFIIFASLGKAGQFPMSSWLPTAMEGPTPSSAIFYGALSVHLGPFLLLRFYDYFHHFPVLLFSIAGIGIISALYSTFVGRTRTDAKTMLAYATISQVGIIYVEIALGLTNLALFHVVTHAALRTYQFLRSSSLIQDFIENPTIEQDKAIRRNFSFELLFTEKIRKRIYIHSLHGFHLDYFTKKVIDGLLYPMKAYVDFEERWRKLDTKMLRFFLRKFK
jgi:NADH:ubiquinone oxidoreductase subunit 5 (subunit L)/multisubunit Na+/H+ antiporter MnhA subunit